MKVKKLGLDFSVKVPFNVCTISKSDPLREIYLLVYLIEVYVLYSVDIYLFKVNNRNTRARCEICSKLPIKTPGRRQCFYC